jgi:hypothetical protein
VPGHNPSAALFAWLLLLAGVSAIAAGDFHVLALVDGVIHGFGDDRFGQV